MSNNQKIIKNGYNSNTNIIPLQPPRFIFILPPYQRAARAFVSPLISKSIPLILHPTKVSGPTEHPSEAYTSMSPNQRVPTLIAEYPNEQQVTFTHYLSMLEYFEEVYPGARRLLPPVTDMRAPIRHAIWHTWLHAFRTHARRRRGHFQSCRAGNTTSHDACVCTNKW